MSQVNKHFTQHRPSVSADALKQDRTSGVNGPLVWAWWSGSSKYSISRSGRRSAGNLIHSTTVDTRDEYGTDLHNQHTTQTQTINTHCTHTDRPIQLTHTQVWHTPTQSTHTHPSMAHTHTINTHTHTSMAHTCTINRHHTHACTAQTCIFHTHTNRAQTCEPRHTQI